jgi:hypothetical protein
VRRLGVQHTIACEAHVEAEWTNMSGGYPLKIMSRRFDAI